MIRIIYSEDEKVINALVVVERNAYGGTTANFVLVSDVNEVVDNLRKNYPDKKIKVSTIKDGEEIRLDSISKRLPVDSFGGNIIKIEPISGNGEIPSYLSEVVKTRGDYKALASEGFKQIMIEKILLRDKEDGLFSGSEL